jgi:NAD-dependent dihydropyrimidine dehydrogenase PreA subunit
MKKVTLNYWLDLATGIAFLACAVTGVVFLFPSLVQTSGGAPSIAWIPATWWHTLHDWSGVAMAAGVAVHLVMHATWIRNMTRKTFRTWRKDAPANSAQRNPATRPAPASAAAEGAAGAGQVATYATPQAADAAAATSLRRLADLRAERRREREQRISRRRFLAGAGAVGGLALLAGAGLVGRDAISEAVTTSGAATTSSGTSAGTTSSTTTSSGSTDQSSSSSQGSTTATTVRVVVDENACVACGRCLQACPKSVFGWSSSGRATAESPDACIRCGRCLQVCPAGAITVSA